MLLLYLISSDYLDPLRPIYLCSLIHMTPSKTTSEDFFILLEETESKDSTSVMIFKGFYLSPAMHTTYVHTFTYLKCLPTSVTVSFLCVCVYLFENSARGTPYGVQ